LFIFEYIFEKFCFLNKKALLKDIIDFLPVDWSQVPGAEINS
jgi:hypothetical protein